MRPSIRVTKNTPGIEWLHENPDNPEEFMIRFLVGPQTFGKFGFIGTLIIVGKGKGVKAFKIKRLEVLSDPAPKPFRHIKFYCSMLGR